MMVTCAHLRTLIFSASILIVHIVYYANSTSEVNNINLPSEQIPYYFSLFPELEKQCKNDPSCPFKKHLDKNVCWGFEDTCPLGRRSYSHPICDGDHKGWVKTKEEQIETFYKQADFGYVRSFRNSLRLLCKPESIDESSLECSENLTFCRGRKIMINFEDLPKRTSPVVYDMDVLKKGQIGGKCKLIPRALDGEFGKFSTLQNWSPELKNFVELNVTPTKGSQACDVLIKKPVIIMKLDAPVNMYHHFCDFFNLYASLFVNSTLKHSDIFSTDVRILIWRTISYSSNFEPTFRAFTSHPLWDLNKFSGKKVCFENVVFPLLPRMIFGLYYNTPLIWGCRNSGLFHAFSKFILHRLGVPIRQKPTNRKIKITFLSRDTKFRRALNEDNLVSKVAKLENIVIEKVVFKWSTDFVHQLATIQNTDILIGMHGAGLTHLMFLPDWGVVFELYNCEDVHCYSDLARLRGVKYITWSNASKLQQVDEDPPPEIQGSRAKHTNYIFDTEEFLRLVKVAIKHVQNEFKNRGLFNHDEL